MKSNNPIGFLPAEREKPEDEKEVKISPYEQSLLDCFTEMISAKYRPGNSIKTATLLLSTQEVIDRMGKGKSFEVHNILMASGYTQYNTGHASVWLFEDK